MPGALLLVFVPLFVISCDARRTAPATAREPGETVRDYASLVARLRGAGLTVEEAGGTEQPFFTPKARVVRIAGDGEAQVYEYADARKAESEARRVNADGSVGTSMPMWVAPPHFFQRDRLIVLYLGSDQRVLGALAAAMGAQLAGSQRPR